MARLAYLFARPTLPPIYFPLNFHHAFNNITCITINLRVQSSALWIIRTVIPAWLRMAPAHLYPSLTNAKLITRRCIDDIGSLTYSVQSANLTIRECYNQNSGLCAMRLWRFTGRIRSSCALLRTTFPAEQSYEVVGKVPLHLLKRYAQSFKGFFCVRGCEVNP